MKTIKTTDIFPNKKNPRRISGEKLKKLTESINDFPKMMELRPIVINEAGEILGGNMRYQAIIALGYSEIPETWVKRADNLSEDEQRRFIIEDNVGFGEWDTDLLLADWTREELEDWGLEVPDWSTRSYSEKNKEIDLDDFPDKMELVFELEPDEFKFVMAKLGVIDESKERALLKLLEYAPV